VYHQHTSTTNANDQSYGVTPLLSGRGRRAVAIILIVEHLVYAITRAIGWLISDTPKNVKIGIARQNYMRSQLAATTSSATVTSSR
jgi:hypothetical protein